MRVGALLLGICATTARAAAAATSTSSSPPASPSGRGADGTVVGSGPSALCGGPSTGGVWKLYDDGRAAKQEGQSDAHRDSIYMDIDTSRCAFERSPTYVVSMQQASADPSAAAAVPDTLTLTAGTPKSVRVTMWDPVMSGAALLAVATHHGWTVNWAGETGANSGHTATGATQWKLLEGAAAGGKTVFYMDVDTRPSALDKRGGFAHYFAALRADWTAESELGLWHLQGARSVHAPTATGFRVYARLTVDDYSTLLSGVFDLLFSLFIYDDINN